MKNITALKPGKIGFPKLLGEIPGTPEKIFIKGNVEVLSESAVAIVGTRRASRAGLEVAEKFARALAREGLVIVSGLAMGIDTAAHRGALKAGGKTIAVLGGDIGKIYPAQNENLAREIITTGGAIVSEYGGGEPTYPSRFLERNRITSGLALASVVIEAPQKSGALSTAGHAAVQGREVFVVPGPVTHANYRGSHELIRDGATLVTSPEEVLSELGFERSLENSPAEKAETPVISALKSAGGPMSIEEIIKETGITPAQIAVDLGLLLLDRKIVETPGGYALI